MSTDTNGSRALVSSCSTAAVFANRHQQNRVLRNTYWLLAVSLVPTVIGAMVVFLFAAWALNPLCAALAPVALIWIATYSYTKRFTDWTHLWLGGALAIAPVGGYVAITGAWSEPWWLLLVIALAVTCWVAGFDVFYALQDEAFDRTERLRSLVVRTLTRAGLACDEASRIEEAEATPSLGADLDRQKVSIGELHIDRGYLAGRSRLIRTR